MKVEPMAPIGHVVDSNAGLEAGGHTQGGEGGETHPKRLSFLDR